MAELIIFVIFAGALVLGYTGAVIAYKVKTHSKKSVWELMNEL